MFIAIETRAKIRKLQPITLPQEGRIHPCPKLLVQGEVGGRQLDCFDWASAG
jgi:hypothetical protein